MTELEFIAKRNNIPGTPIVNIDDKLIKAIDELMETNVYQELNELYRIWNALINHIYERNISLILQKDVNHSKTEMKITAHLYFNKDTRFENRITLYANSRYSERDKILKIIETINETYVSEIRHKIYYEVKRLKYFNKNLKQLLEVSKSD